MEIWRGKWPWRVYLRIERRNLYVNIVFAGRVFQYNLDILFCRRCKMPLNKKTLEEWGNNRYYCTRCSSILDSTFPPMNPVEINLADAEESSTYSGAGGLYWPHSGNITIIKGNEWSIHHTINHEWMHRVLHEHVGRKACSQYDRICSNVDPYHDPIIGGV